VASRAVALVLAEWFPNVIQSIEPFVSATDISKGANWAAVLQKELADSDFGVVCLAPDNLQSPWLNYEAGAIATSVDSLVCPVLFHVEKEKVQSPIAQLQLTSLDEADVLLLMQSMNKATKSPLNGLALTKAVEMWWPKLEEELDQIDVPTDTALSAQDVEPEQPQVEVSEMVKELLHIVRGLDAKSSVRGFGSQWARFEEELRERQLEKIPPKRPDVIWGPEGMKIFNAAEPAVDNPYIALFLVLETFGFAGEKGSNTPNGFDLYTTDTLPEKLPPALSAELSRAASTTRSTVRLLGPNRIFSFGKTGYLTELPPEPR
jgi:hypothetical protein